MGIFKWLGTAHHWINTSAWGRYLGAPVIISVPPAIITLMENDTAVKEWITAHNWVLYGVIFGPTGLVLLNNFCFTLREKFGERTPDLSCATLLLATISRIVGVKRQQLQNTAARNGTLNSAVTPTNQINVIVREMAYFFGSILDKKKFAVEMEPLVEVTLVKIENGKYKELIYRYPEGRPIRSDLEQLRDKLSAFSKACERPGTVLIEESTADAIRMYHNHPLREKYCNYVPGCAEHETEDKSQLCYFFSAGPEDCYCIAVTASAPKLYSEQDSAIYKYAFNEFESRIVTEMYFSKLKGANNGGKKAKPRRN